MPPAKTFPVYCVIPTDFDVKHGGYSMAVKDCVITNIKYGTGKKCNVFGLLAAASADHTGERFIKKILDQGIEFEHLLLQARWDAVHGAAGHAEINRIMASQKVGTLHKASEFKECWKHGGRSRTALAIKDARDIKEFGEAVESAAEWMEGRYTA